MNIAITAGIQLMPPGFGAGLNVWSREDGLSGQTLWSGAPNAAVVPGDQDFGTCLEIQKLDSLTRLRFVGETPILPGTYLRISARVKAVAGSLPQVRIAGWAGTAARAHVTGVVEVGPTVSLPGYGAVVEVSAIVGTGSRGGVHMPWGTQATLGHFGLDLTGPNGGSVRIESIRIEDITSAFIPNTLDWVDVRDYGARGDGVTDNYAAFLAADAAAAGGEIVVPAGTYYISTDLSLKAPVRFKGTLSMPRAARLALHGRFDFPTYADAFGSETEGIKRAIQALFGFTDHMTLDLCGRRVDLTEPLDIAAIAPGITSYSNRRMIVNGQFGIVAGAPWTTGVVSGTGTYDPARPYELKGVANAAQIERGSLISGAGVGREVYVRSVNVAAGTLTLSQPLYGGAGTRSYTFTRFRYAFDFSGIQKLERFCFSDIEFLTEGLASGILLPSGGALFTVRDCYFTRPKDRGITSIGDACQDLIVDQCQFLSDETAELSQNRDSVAINVNANDSKIRNNRFVRFGSFMVASGAGHIISGNHWFQGDNATLGLRSAGLVLTGRNAQVNVTGNYIDNATIEWTNEHSAQPNFTGAEYTFGGLTITGNTFLCSNVAAGFSWLVVKPYGAGHYLHGLSVMGNVFKCSVGRITRVDKVDTSVSDLNYAMMRNIRFEGNTFTGVDVFVANPLPYTHTEGSATTAWLVPAGTGLPFNGYAKKVEGLVAETAITNASAARVAEMPWIATEQGAQRKHVILNWTQPAQGRVSMQVRMDNPL